MPKVFKDLYSSKLFLLVLGIKIISGCIFASYYMSRWFTPFVSYYVTSGFSDPWQFFLSQGEPKAFPYQPLMLWIFSIPRFLLSPFISSNWQEVSAMNLFIMRLPLLLADLTIYSVLALWFKNSVARVRMFYWYSPIVYYICYYHGQLDIIPTALFLLSLFYMQRGSGPSMLFLGLALGTKAHILVSLPFLFVYQKQFKSYLYLAKDFAFVAGAYLLCSLPYLNSPAFKQMVMNNEEQYLVFAYRFLLPVSNVAIYICPAILLLLFLRFSAYPKKNWDLNMFYLGMAFCSFVLLVPPMPGWYMWAFPFIVYFYCKEDRLDITAFTVFTAFYLLYFLVTPHSQFYDSLAFTLMQTSLAVLVLMMYKVGVRSNEVYKARERPTLIGIAGDSGAGKDILSSLISDLLGKDFVIALNGDDYHKWERGNKQWKVMTHLDVKTNRLHELLQHAIALHEGRSIEKISYSHSSGRFTEPKQVDSNKYILVSGLHSFVIEKMRDMFDLKIFLDPDEELRRFWKAKRDVKERGHALQNVLESLNKRENDRNLHILPQREKAEIVLSFKSEDKISLENLDFEPSLVLEMILANNFNLDLLEEVLCQEPEVTFKIEHHTAESHQKITFKGDLTSERVQSIANTVIPNLGELTREQAIFHPGFNGAIQLILLSCLSNMLSWKGDTKEFLDGAHSRSSWLGSGGSKGALNY